MIKRIYLILTVLLFAELVMAQNIPPLERKIVLDLRDHRVVDVLTEIGKQASCTFSYNSSLVPLDKTVSLSVKNKTVRETLDILFKGKLKYRAKGDYIILSKAPDEQKVISGYVEDEEGKKIAGASVYDSRTLASATTDEFGYYEMKIRRSRPAELSVAKSAYLDTVVPLQPMEPGLQTIVLAQESGDTTFRKVINDLRDAGDTIASFLQAAGKWSVEQFTFNKNVENIRDTIYRDVQISFVPFVGTGGRLSGNVITRSAFNLLVGYNRGVQGCEFAGFANIDRGDVSLFQSAGFANLVGGEFHGVQFAGFTNIDRKKTEGAQFAGFLNLNASSFDGVQFAGFTNINRRSGTAISFAGFSNISGGDAIGAHFAGFSNIHAGNLKGAQFAGFLNLVSGRLEGAQFSGCINVAGEVKGAQLGVFNFADSVSGIPLGLLSFVRKGYHKIELAYDEMNYGHLALRTGVNYFYNILSAGTQIAPFGDTVNWTFGYGVGSSVDIARRWSLNLDLTANQIVYGNLQRPLNQLVKAGLGCDFHISRNISIAAGITANAYFTETSARLMPGIDDRRMVYSADLSPDYSLRTWLGWRVALRFF